MLLTSDVGDFNFNWIGLYSSENDVVVAIAYLPTLSKWKTVHPTMGNALTRNFMLEYSGLADVTQIMVEASTWQIDFTARMKGIDERERLSNFDIYGGACFFDDGFLVVDDGGTFKLQPGLGYVEGIRIVQAAEQILAPALPAEVFLDVALQPQGSDRVAVVQVVYADPGDYVDGTNDNHYGQKIAEIGADRTITDFRPKTPGGELGDVYANKDHVHGEYANKVHSHPSIETDYIDLSAFSGGASAGTIETAVNGQKFPCKDFPNDTDVSEEITYVMPESWDCGNIKAKLVWTPGEGAVAGHDIVFNLQARAISDGEDLDITFTETGVTLTDKVIAEGKKQKTGASAALTAEGNPALGDEIHFRLTRDVSEGATPMAAECRVLALIIQYTCNQPVAAW